ncbi:hypothetical protein EG349_10410 [Chryseobacterium shandongense]|uniref:Uncharacterized protein n=2 Tax=Chryseobacterium TaxID=59732 RepID=A0AAD0YCA4_9FLAO|nr:MULTISPECIES: hypothetical protein [Chryseobacterium]AZA87172.1 hypothetical protein EG349_10410 [Chryseobacterium shandongense]AZA95601.1 hypothetical protein EG353_08485 [Chryseobacterium shandongense]MEC3876119.1 hypothetical protein [Chryseobacterium sp. T9W2-O]
MKKLILVVAIVATGLVSAKDGEKIKVSEDTNKKEVVQSKASQNDTPPDDTKMQCYEYSMFIPCTETFITDTQCWGPGSGTATWEDAWDCIQQNGSLAVDYFCG